MNLPERSKAQIGYKERLCWATKSTHIKGYEFHIQGQQKLVKCVFKEKILLKFNIHRVKSTGVYFFFRYLYSIPLKDFKKDLLFGEISLAQE